ncbi:MAG: hypothetical protein ABI377_04095 [Devosia sp.]
MPRDSDQVAFAASLDAQHAKTAFLAVERHPFNETAQRFTALSGPFHPVGPLDNPAACIVSY